jgi:hypothetical protein
VHPARDHRLTGIGVDISTVFIGSARAGTSKPGVTDRVSFVHGDASGLPRQPPISIAAGWQSVRAAKSYAEVILAWSHWQGKSRRISLREMALGTGSPTGM